MESMIKAFTGIFFTLLVAFIGATLISAAVDSRNADAFLSDAVAEMESSNCSTRTINEWKNKAKQENDSYNLVVDTPVLNSTTGRYETTATLNYKYRIPIIGMNSEKKTTNIVR